MSLPLILVSMLVVCAGVAGWLWLCGGMLRPGWRGVVGRLAVQVSALCLVYGVLRGQPMPGLFMALFPPLAVIYVAPLVEFGGFLAQLAWAALPYAAAILVLGLVVRVLRPWTLGLTGLAALVAAVLLGDGVAETAMCQTAKEHGIDGFSRLGLSDSLTQGWQRPVAPHGFAETGEGRFGWSYRLMDWYSLPEGQGTSPPSQSVACRG